MSTSQTRLRQRQRDAIWKWQWLGLRDSTPGFKGIMIALLGVAVYLALRAFAVV
jgi:hypothetical protein